MGAVEAFLTNSITGWGAAGLVSGFVLWLIFTDRLQARRRAKEMADLWEASSNKWVNATHTRDIQLTMALDQLRIVGTFFSEVDVRQIEDIERTAEAGKKP